jgi:hypothetical protein
VVVGVNAGSFPRLQSQHFCELGLQVWQCRPLNCADAIEINLDGVVSDDPRENAQAPADNHNVSSVHID